MSFDKLPFELKERILLYLDDFESASQVSKSWRYNIKTSKKILQKELDKYYFFFVVWCFDEYQIDEGCFMGTSSHFIFSITTEAQLLFFKNVAPDPIKGIQMSIGALQRGLEFFFPKDYNDGYTSTYYFKNKLTPEDKSIEQEENISIGNTETLMKRLKHGGKHTIHKYILEICKPVEHNDYLLAHSHVYDEDLDRTKSTNLIKGIKFYDKTLMLELLRNEHKVFIDLSNEFFFMAKPDQYDKLYQFLYEFEIRKGICVYSSDDCSDSSNSNDDEDTILTRLKNVYKTISKSLFFPYWRYRVEMIEDHTTLDAFIRRFTENVYDPDGF